MTAQQTPRVNFGPGLAPVTLDDRIADRADNLRQRGCSPAFAQTCAEREIEQESNESERKDHDQ